MRRCLWSAQAALDAAAAAVELVEASMPDVAAAFAVAGLPLMPVVARWLAHGWWGFLDGHMCLLAVVMPLAFGQRAHAVLAAAVLAQLRPWLRECAAHDCLAERLLGPGLQARVSEGGLWRALEALL